MSLIVVLTNTSQLAPISDYKVQVLIGDGTVERTKTLYEGTVEGHRRADGWPMLLQQFVNHLPVPVPVKP